MIINAGIKRIVVKEGYPDEMSVRMLDEAGCDAMIEVDGGLNTETCVPFIEAGMNVMVAGSALFGAPDAKAFVDAVRAADQRING